MTMTWTGYMARLNAIEDHYDAIRATRPLTSAERSARRDALDTLSNYAREA